MDRRSFGSTSLLVTPLGLGLAALGRPGYNNLGHAEDLEGEYSVETMRSHSHTVLDAAWEAGIRYYDAARSYGRAEEFLGSWLRSRSIPPEAVTVGSKWGYVYTAGWKVDAEVHEVKEHSLDVLRRQWEESDEHLGPYLDLYQIHSATLESGVLSNEAVLDELARYKQDGLVIGLTLSGAKQAETLYRALEVRRDGELLFQSVQATWNLLEPSAGPALQAAHDAGLGVIVKEALANGRLTPKNDAPGFTSKRHLLEEAAQAAGVSIDALALAAVLGQPWVDVVLSGAATVEQLRSNVDSLRVTWTPALAGRLESLAEPAGVYWAKRSELDWN